MRIHLLRTGAHKANSSDKGGGLGALTTLARAVEQEKFRDELSLQLTNETKALDVLRAEVTASSPHARVHRRKSAFSRTCLITLLSCGTGDQSAYEGWPGFRIEAFIQPGSSYPYSVFDGRKHVPGIVLFFHGRRCFA